ncbi:MAG TPA: LysM peptidoglycan-binding domain-containing protein [Bacteroidales bacterium]|nr:LysM peptidoglycan-binding domain-containing protein [Bacteroidales bacterium]
MTGIVQTTRESICPYLGLIEDPATSLTYPSANCYCHRTQPAAVPSLEQQLSYCLTEQYASCVVFKAQAKQNMPEELKMKAWRKRKGRKKSFHLIILAVLLVCILIALIAYFQQNKQDDTLMIPSQTMPATTTSLAVSLITPRSALATYSVTEAPTLTPQPKPSLTPTEIREGHYLETPFGKEQLFIVHRVNPGESLLFLATQHNTTPEIIKAVNNQLIVPIWVDSILIIPLDCIDLAGLPAFEAFQITENGLTLRELAEGLAIDLEALVDYNNIPADGFLINGEWVLIPRASNQ